jgi:hypothetical protein
MSQSDSSGAAKAPIDIQKSLKGISYPADKKTLLDTARSNGADEAVLAALEALPEQKYASPADVSKGVGKEESDR